MTDQMEMAAKSVDQLEYAVVHRPRSPLGAEEWQRGVQCCGRERAQDSQAVPRPSHHSAHPPVQSGAPD
ncbi:hypothetical protein ACKKBF_B39855 [Auxenochlorella protothecoides x Auxenochlorella symbiontica]